MDDLILDTVGQTTQLHVIAKMSDGTEQDVTQSGESCFTTYRTTNSFVARVDSTGLLTAIGKGVIRVTATNEGVTAVSQRMKIARLLTTVVGRVVDENNNPIINGTVGVIGDSPGTTGSDGTFSLPNTIADDGEIVVGVGATESGDNLRGSVDPGKKMRTEGFSEGPTI